MGPSRLYAEDLLRQTDQRTRIPFLGLFLYTQEMPAISSPTSALPYDGQMERIVLPRVSLLIQPVYLYHC